MKDSACLNPMFKTSLLCAIKLLLAHPNEAPQARSSPRLSFHTPNKPPIKLPVISRQISRNYYFLLVCYVCLSLFYVIIEIEAAHGIMSVYAFPNRHLEIGIRSLKVGSV